MGISIGGGAGVGLALGAVWTLTLSVTDGATRVDDTPTVTITPPGGGPGEPATVARLSTGFYTASYVTAAPGVHGALIVTTLHGSAGAVCNVTAVATAAAWPDVDDLANYLGAHSATDEELASALAAETGAQFDVCRIPGVYPIALREALLRRCARNLALRGLPLAVLRGDSESGDTVLPGSDPEVRRLEKPWRKIKVG